VVARAERAGLAGLRADAARPATGRTLEVGAGTGQTLPHLPPSAGPVVLSDPSAPMATGLAAAVAGASGQRTVVRAGADGLPFPDATFDTVVASFVLCTVPDPARAVGEIARVLRPGGRYLFLEHVRAPDGSVLGRFQDLLAPVHEVVACGCRPDRRTADVLGVAPGLRVERLDRAVQHRASPTVRPLILGSAVRVAGP
jgi:ubiquinone/menaquinone biosynthesis C-methylase UbiE